MINLKEVSKQKTLFTGGHRACAGCGAAIIARQVMMAAGSELRVAGVGGHNARVGLRGKDQRWAVEFWGQNIFNQDYTQVAFSSPLQSGQCPNSSTCRPSSMTKVSGLR